MGLDISRIFTDHDFNIIGHHRNSLLPDEWINKVSNPDIDTASKPNFYITQCTKYLFNDPLNININTSSYNVVCKCYVTPTTLPKYRKKVQPGRISSKEGNRPEESHLTYLQKDH